MTYYTSMIILVPFILFALFAQNRVKANFKKYFNVASKKGMTGEEVARMILRRNGLSNVPVHMQNKGALSNHYDPRKREIYLSREIYSSRSITAISVAAHEVGHAIQHAKAYTPLSLRHAVFPIVSIASKAYMPLVMLGFFMGARGMIDLGIILFSAIIFFQTITLPVEFNASSRALKELKGNSLVYSDELSKSKKVLNAAALTYVAAVATSIGTLLRLLILRNARD